MSRIKHNARAPRVPKPPVITEAYQREVDAATEKLSRRYAEASRRAEKAAARLADAERRTRDRVVLDALRAEVDRRLAELQELEWLMRSSPAGAGHRGTEGWRKVPR